MKSTLAILFLAFLMVPVFCLQAFEVRGAPEVGPTAFIKWDVTKGPVPIILNSLGTKDVPLAAVQTALQSAMAAWQNVPSQTVRFQYSGTSSSAVPSTTDSRNSVVWVNNWAYPSSMVAVTRYSYYIDTNPKFADADIMLNGRDFHYSTTGVDNVSKKDLQQVLLHELGHFLGLSHSSSYNAILYPTLTTKVSHLLTLDDKAGLQFLYGSAPAAFSPVTPVANAIYVEQMVSKGLPLPSFRWAKGSGTTFTIEFSSTTSFAKKISFPSSTSYFVPNSTQMPKLIALSTTKIIYWRVQGGGVTTLVRKLSFKTIL